MSTITFAKLRRLSIWVSQLALLVSVIGCSSTEEWPAYRFYEGDMRPLNEVAVILVKGGVDVLGIDDYSAPYNHSDTEEFHVLPGKHEIRVLYHRTVHMRTSDTGGIAKDDTKGTTFTRDLSAGTVYLLWTNTDGAWTLNINSMGSVNELACSSWCDPPNSFYNAIYGFISPGYIDYVPPNHWMELRRSICPDKAVRSNK